MEIKAVLAVRAVYKVFVNMFLSEAGGTHLHQQPKESRRNRNIS